MKADERALLSGAALSALTLACALALLELGALRCGLHRLPLRWHGCLPRALRVLAQSSKRGVIPRDYAALLGDSYAEGFGDWFLDASPWRNGPFGSQHVLHERTGWDVVSLGQSGNGSLAGLAGTPVSILDYLDRTAFFKVSPPRRILAYFYEGNDLDDNLRDLNKRFDGGWDRARLRQPEYFQRFVARTVVDENSLGRETADFHWTDNFFFLRSARSLVRDAWKQWRDPIPVVSDDWSGRETTRAVVAGRPTPLPDGLQAPSLELDPSEVELGVYVFEQSLRFLARRFPGTKVDVVYVPSPLSCYRLCSPGVVVESYWSRGSAYPAKRVAARSDELAGLIAAASRRQGAGFFDSRPALRAAAAEGFIHGPRDWKHFNRRGYTALAEAVAPLLSEHDGDAR